MNCAFDGIVVEILKAVHRGIMEYEKERAAGRPDEMAETLAATAAAESFIREWRALPASEGDK